MMKRQFRTLTDIAKVTRVDSPLAVETSKSWKSRVDDAGASLILALIYIVAISLVVTALANWVTNDLNNTTTFNNAAQFDSALRSVTELGIQNIRYTPLMSKTSPGPGECWVPSSGSVSSQSFNGYSVAVWCSTVENLASSATRVVTLDACPTTVTSGQACHLNPALRAKVVFDDYLPGNSSLLTSTCVLTCGESATTQEWTFGGVAGGVPSPSTTTTISGVTTIPTSTTSTTISPSSTTTSSTTTTSTTTTSTTTTSTTTTTTIAAMPKLVILSVPQTMVTTKSSPGSTSGSIVVQTQTDAGAPIVQSSNLPVELSYSTNGKLSSPYGPVSITIPAHSSFATAVFTVRSNQSSNEQSFTVGASSAGYTTSLAQTEIVEPDAQSSSTTFLKVQPQAVSTPTAPATFTIPVVNNDSAPHYFEITSVGGLLAGEAASGPQWQSCFKVKKNNSKDEQVTISATSTRFASSISPTTLNFVVTRYSHKFCTNVDSTNYYQANATLTVG